MSEKDYILGTYDEELFRLGIQHQIWASEAHTGWKTARFGLGDTILDLGAGPGFCAKELGFVVGKKGKVIAVDKSKKYIDYLKKISAIHRINVDTICCDFDDLDLEETSLDGMYCRWALAWIDNPQLLLKKIKTFLKDEAKMVIHEYFDWKTHSTTPDMPNISTCLKKTYESFNSAGNNIDIGRYLPNMLEELGMKIISLRPMNKLVRPNELEWRWPSSFYRTYFPDLVNKGYVSQEVANSALEELHTLEEMKNAMIFTPAMIEIIASK